MILIWIITLGLLNFLSFTVIYAFIGGDAANGKIDNGRYYVRGHFLRHGTEGQLTEVSASIWAYSYIHSISIWPTSGAVLCAMLLLARPHIIATMKEHTFATGQYFVAASMTIIIIVTASSMLYFLVDFVQAIRVMRGDGIYGA